MAAVILVDAANVVGRLMVSALSSPSRSARPDVMTKQCPTPSGIGSHVCPINALISMRAGHGMSDTGPRPLRPLGGSTPA